MHNISVCVPYMNTTTHGCDYEGPCKISTVLSLKRGTRFLILGPEASRVVVSSGRSGRTKCHVSSLRPSAKVSTPSALLLVISPNSFVLFWIEVYDDGLNHLMKT